MNPTIPNGYVCSVKKLLSRGKKKRRDNVRVWAQRNKAREECQDENTDSAVINEPFDCHWSI